jgi:small subunit ribosomal protein S10
MAKAGSKHVVPTASGGWAVKSEGAARAARLFDTQSDAVEYAHTLAKGAQAELYVHGRDGSVLSKSSYEPRRIQIRLKALDDKLIEQSVLEIVDTARRTGAIVKGPLPLPQSVRRLEVLRSLKTGKTPGAPAEVSGHQRLMDIVDPSDKTVAALMKLTLPAGVDFEINKH